MHLPPKRGSYHLAAERGRLLVPTPAGRAAPEWAFFLVAFVDRDEYHLLNRCCGRAPTFSSLLAQTAGTILTLTVVGGVAGLRTRR